MAPSDEVFLLNNTLATQIRHGNSQPSFAKENGGALSRPPVSSSRLRADGSGLFPVCRSELFGIEDGGIQFCVTVDLGVFLAEDFLPVEVNFHQRGDPSAAQFAVVGETNVLRLVRIAPVRLQQAHK